MGGGEEGWSNSYSVNCKRSVIGIFKTASEEKMTRPNLLFLRVNEELGLPFVALDGSREARPS